MYENTLTKLNRVKYNRTLGVTLVVGYLIVFKNLLGNIINELLFQITSYLYMVFNLWSCWNNIFTLQVIKANIIFYNYKCWIYIHPKNPIDLRKLTFYSKNEFNNLKNRIFLSRISGYVRIVENLWSWFKIQKAI